MPKSRGGATIGNSLSSSMKARLKRLREDLDRKAKASIDAQLSRPKPPWSGHVKKASLKHQVRTKSPSQTALSLRDGTPQPKSGLSSGRQGRVPGLGKAGVKPTQVQSKRARTNSFHFWDLPPEAPVREKAPISVSDADRGRFDNSTDVASLQAASQSGEILYVILGLDFGTSSTKVIARFPYEPGVPTVAIPSPAFCRSGGHAYLWQTVLWLRQSGSFLAWPERGARLLHSLKQGIMGHHPDAQLSRELPVTPAAAATAFVAYVIRYARGWLLANRPAMFRNRTSVWFVNVGLPAASYDDPVLVFAYRKVAAASLLMAKSRRTDSRRNGVAAS